MMQNFIAAAGPPSSSSPIIIGAPSSWSSSPTRNLPGRQRKQHDACSSRRSRLPSPGILIFRGSRLGADRHSPAILVMAFFGGSKSPPVKSAGKGCFSCLGKGAVDCAGCKGTGKNKKNGNMFERWKCYDCQGFGMISCPKCGTGGLTPEQRGER